MSDRTTGLKDSLRCRVPATLNPKPEFGKVPVSPISRLGLVSPISPGGASALPVRIVLNRLGCGV